MRKEHKALYQVAVATDINRRFADSYLALLC